MQEGQMGWTRNLWNIGYPSLTTPTPFKSQKLLFNKRALGWNLPNQKAINYISPFNLRASVETRPPKLPKFSPPSISRPTPFVRFCDTSFSSIFLAAKSALLLCNPRFSWREIAQEMAWLLSSRSNFVFFGNLISCISSMRILWPWCSVSSIFLKLFLKELLWQKKIADWIQPICL